MITIGDTVTVNWTWGGHRFQAAGVVTKVSGKTVKVRLTEDAGEHFHPGFVVTTHVENVRKESNMRASRRTEAHRYPDPPQPPHHFVSPHAEATRPVVHVTIQDESGAVVHSETRSAFNSGIDASEKAIRKIALSEHTVYTAGRPVSNIKTAADNEEATYTRQWVSKNGRTLTVTVTKESNESRRRREFAEEATSPRVADFDSLDDLIAHAGSELGATHAVIAGPETKIYFPRGGQHPYEEARVWRKGGYWHAEGPGARTGVRRLPAEARPIEGGKGQRAAEAPQQHMYVWEISLMVTSPERPSLRHQVQYRVQALSNDKAGAIEQAKKLAARDKYTVVEVVGVSRGHKINVRETNTVRDYEAIDNRNRRIAGPFKSYSDAKQAAGTAGHVEFVPSKGRATEEAPREQWWIYWSGHVDPEGPFDTKAWADKWARAQRQRGWGPYIVRPGTGEPEPRRATEEATEEAPKLAQRFRVGSRVVMTPDAIDNYGANWQGIVFKVTHVSTAYMPADEFFSKGKPEGYHPGFDPEAGSALYDIAIEGTGEGLDNSFYDWELAPAPGSMTSRHESRRRKSRGSDVREGGPGSSNQNFQQGERVRIRIIGPKGQLTDPPFWYTIPYVIDLEELALQFSQTIQPGMFVSISDGKNSWTFQKETHAGQNAVRRTHKLPTARYR